MTTTEENYLKCIFHLAFADGKSKEVAAQKVSERLGVKPASVNSMLKKLKEKKTIDFQKYGKITLTELGKEKALFLIRKHRLWETFLFEKLDFAWDEVHEVAEELEHIHSQKLIHKLDEFLGFPDFDPHGHPIPKKDGKMVTLSKSLLCDIEVGKSCKMVGVKDSSAAFLQYIVSLGIGIGDTIEVISIEPFDLSTTLKVGEKSLVVSHEFAKNVFVV
ncbi:MAG: iron-dependent repressor [Flavobacteriaceae bacterium]|nr:MAG: iron-dependent repressor [Flavobacteriaceae bacterium]